MDGIFKTLKALENNPKAMDDFIKKYEPFILKSASKTCKRYITKSDDEWSIALFAFHKAIQNYKDDKGSFFTFSERIIHNALVDYFRKQGKFHQEIQVEILPETKEVSTVKVDIKDEINSITPVLKSYNISFMDLTLVSPKAKKTKEACSKVVVYLLDHPLLINHMQEEKQLPIKIIQKNLKLPRKLLERHRKYIIAVVEILKGDYPYLSEYLKDLKGGSK